MIFNYSFTPSAPTTPALPVPSSTAWTNPTDWVPCQNDRVRLHLHGLDALTLKWYADHDVHDLDEATIGKAYGTTDEQRYVCHLLRPRSRVTGVVLPVAQLEYRP